MNELARTGGLPSHSLSAEMYVGHPVRQNMYPAIIKIITDTTVPVMSQKLLGSLYLGSMFFFFTISFIVTER